MKEKGFIFTSFVLMLLIISACKSKNLSSPLVIGASSNANAMVVTGYGYSSSVFYMNFANSAGYYDTALQQTLINTNEDTDSLHIQLLIRYNGETTFYEQDTIPNLFNASDSILFTNKNSHKTTFYSPVYPKNFLTITKYDNVGGHIEGIFSGDFVNVDNDKDSLKISNGRFSVIRLPDGN